MIFRKLEWQRVVSAKIKKFKLYSYGKLAAYLRCSKSQSWALCNNPLIEVGIDDYLLICRYLEINPLDYIVKDEVQLKLI